MSLVTVPPCHIILPFEDAHVPYTFDFEGPARNSGRSVYRDAQRVLIDADDEAAALAWGQEISERFFKLLYRDENASGGDRYTKRVETPAECRSDVQHVHTGEYPDFEPWLERYEGKDLAVPEPPPQDDWIDPDSRWAWFVILQVIAIGLEVMPFAVGLGVVQSDPLGATHGCSLLFSVPAALIAIWAAMTWRLPKSRAKARHILALFHGLFVIALVM